MACRRIASPHLLLALLLAVPGAAGPAPEAPPPKPAWAAAFKPFDDSPKSIAYLVAQKAFSPGTCLVLGLRPRDDRPTAGRPFFGPPPGPGDWVVEDDTGAIAVKGLPPPEPGQRVVLAARFAPGEPGPCLQGIQLAAAGRRDGTDVLSVGAFMHFPLSSTKSTSSYPEFSGDIAAVESFGFLHGVILRGVHPGTVTVRVFEEWWNRPVPELSETFTVRVTAPAPRSWMKELAGAEGIGFTGYPHPLGWQGSHPESYPAPFLVVGRRPPGDKPPADLPLLGARRGETDWVVADDTGALWVTGLPAPAPGTPVVLSGRLSVVGGQVALQGVRFLVAGQRKAQTRLRPGDFVYFPLAGTKGPSCPVEVEGNAAEIVFNDGKDTLILRAVQAGSARVKVFAVGFDDELVPTGEHLLVVE